MASGQTKHRIIQAAEQLFATHGFVRASLRQVTELAEVNLASVNYHFGSKENLVLEVFRRHLDGLNVEREKAFESVMNRSTEQEPPTLSDLLTAFIAPALRLSTDPSQGEYFVQIVTRGYVEYKEELREFLAREYGDINRRFFAAIGKHLPHLPDEEVARRLDFTIGALTYSMGDFGMTKLTDGVDREAYLEATIESLVHFTQAGLIRSATS
ncbi:MAG: TetR/AcrR family transcriptional regulator [Lysobacterales bacterium]